MQVAFETLKEEITSGPVLSCPYFDDPFIVETDASRKEVGAAIAQKESYGKIQPLHFASRTMKSV